MIPRSLTAMLSVRYIGTITPCNKMHTTSCYQCHAKSDQHIRNSSSLWFTTLPKESLTAMVRSGKRKPKGQKPVIMPTGPLLISCKNQKLNHYKGVSYKKFSPVPLASKGWHSKKANGDYFSILPSRKNPAFLLPENVQVDKSFEENEADSDEFKKLGLSDEVIERLRKIGIQNPTGIQLAVIPKLLAGRNAIITGETGCGKTLAYVLPILEHILKWKSKINCEYNTPLAVIVVPSRELALQVGNVISALVKDSDINCKVLLSNHIKKFLLNFNESDLEKVDILVSTLGVLCKFTYHDVYNLKKCLHVVLDEADSLLDDSFSEKLQSLLFRCRFRLGPMLDDDDVPKGAQLSLVSATFPKEFDETLRNILPPESMEKITTKYLHQIPPHIKQNFVRCQKSLKPEKALSLVKNEIKNKRPVIIFSNKTETCNWMAHFLRENNIECARFHSRMANEERVVELKKFREGSVGVLTSTDLGSRGQDIPTVCHVINYEFPRYMADYVHRCGRTGRIGNDDECEVTSFISSIREVSLLNEIEMSARTEKKLAKVDNNIKRILYNKYNPK